MPCFMNSGSLWVSDSMYEYIYISNYSIIKFEMPYRLGHFTRCLYFNKYRYLVIYIQNLFVYNFLEIFFFPFSYFSIA